MTKKKIKEPTETQYRRAEINLAEGYCPPINPCSKCGWPRMEGYCCNTCGNAGE